MSEKFDIEDVKKLSISDDEALVISVDIGELSRHKANEYMHKVMKMFKEGLPDTKIFIVPSTTELTVINNTQE